MSLVLQEFDEEVKSLVTAWLTLCFHVGQALEEIEDWIAVKSLANFGLLKQM